MVGYPSSGEDGEMGGYLSKDEVRIGEEHDRSVKVTDQEGLELFGVFLMN